MDMIADFMEFILSRLIISDYLEIADQPLKIKAVCLCIPITIGLDFATRVTEDVVVISCKKKMLESRKMMKYIALLVIL